MYITKDLEIATGVGKSIDTIAVNVLLEEDSVPNSEIGLSINNNNQLLVDEVKYKLSKIFKRVTDNWSIDSMNISGSEIQVGVTIDDFEAVINLEE